MKSKHSHDNYLYYADHTAKLVHEQWIDTVNHDGKWTEEEEKEDSKKAPAVSFYPRTELVEPLEWKYLENRLKPSSVEPPKLELKELLEHLEYAFLQENNQLPVVISSALSTIDKTRINLPHLQQSLGESCPGFPKKEGMTVVRNEKDELIPQRTVTGWRVCIDYRKLNNATRKDHFPLPFIDQMLERLAGHEYYCFLDGFLGLCNAPTTFWHCMTAIFHELIENSMEVFMDDFSFFGSSFDHCLKNLEKMLKRCEETNLVLNWEKCHFMVKEGIVLGHKVSGSGIEVDKAKIEAISKLPYPTNVKAIQSFLRHAGFYGRFIKDFSQIARPMTQLLVKDAPFNFSEECIQAFDTLKHELTQALIMIKPDWSLPFEIMCDTSDYAVRAVLGQDRQKFQAHTLRQQNNERRTRELHNYRKGASGCHLCIRQIPSILGLIQDHRFYGSFCPAIRDKKGFENLAADHLSRLENPNLGKLTKAEIRDLFPEERLMAISDKNSESCVPTESYEGAWPKMRQHKFFDNVISDHLEDIMASPPP
ncbi:reverse transcriptase domain-containing protein [Tanacetum coccineum]